MTIVQSASFTGVDANAVRPGVRARMLQQFLAVAKDQALNYESLLGIKVPSSSTISATPHVHDGTDGNVIPIPLVQEWIGAQLVPSSSTSVLSDGWGAFHWPMFFAPAGVSSVRVYMFVGTALTIPYLRATVWSGSPLAQGTSYNFSVVDSVDDSGILISADVPVTAGATNTIRMEFFVAAADTAGSPTAGVDHYVPWYSIVPLVGSPIDVAPYSSRGTSEDIVVPSATTHLGAYGFTSFDDGMFDDYMGVSTYIVQRQMLNDAMLYEVATGLPASNNPDGHTNYRQWDGHCHGNASAETGDVGAVMDQCLVAVSYGVARNKVGGAASRATDDEEDTTRADWSGRIFAQELLTGTGTTAQIVDKIPFRMPAAAAADITGAAKLKVAALGRVQTGKGANLQVVCQVFDSTDTTGGTSTTLTFSTSGAQVQSSTIDYTGASAVAAAGELAVLRVSIKATATPSGYPIGCLYGVCLYLEA